MQVQQNACERIYPGDALRPERTRIDSSAVSRGASTGSTLGLPADQNDAPYNAQSALLNRRSARRFNGGSLSLRDLEETLRFAFRPETDPQRAQAASVAKESWAAPLLSRDVLGFHIVVFAVEGLLSGIYRLDPVTLERTLCREGDFRVDLQAVGLGQNLAFDCAFALLYTADMEALVSAYGDRGYRYACLDCGVIGERIQLWAVHRELGSSGIGGYYDDLANELLELPLSHGVLYLTVMGVPEE
jgi:SagB-type dehydrogenase family enzyme